MAHETATKGHDPADESAHESAHESADESAHESTRSAPYCGVMTDVQIPNFGALLAPYIGQVGPALRPRFLALLERGAADRYRYWAELLPAHADGLLACAASEDEIADRIEGAFGIADADRAVVEAPLPGARDAYYAVFDGMDPWDQLRIQANAERQGANAWRSIADAVTDRSVLDALAACSALEEASADYLDGLIAAHG